MSFGSWFGGAPAKAAAETPAEPDSEAVAKFLDYLRGRGRYFRMTRPDGRVVHVLGVTPGSTASCREAVNLLKAVKPDTVYVDTPVDEVAVLRQHVKMGGPPRSRAPPGAEVRMDVGLAMSANLHKAACEEGMFRMLGVDITETWRSAVAMADRSGARVLAWPASYRRRYNNNLAAYERFGELGFSVFGNSGFWSNEVYLVAMVEMTPVKVLDGVGGTLGRVTLPQSGYFSTEQLARMQESHRRAMDAFAKKNSAQSLDFESLFAGQIAAFRDRVTEGGDALPADGPAPPGMSFTELTARRLPLGEARTMVQQMEMARDLFAVQCQTTAGVLVGDDDLAVPDGDRTDSVSTIPRAAAAAGELVPETVALVELPRVAGILRAWDSPLPVAEGLVERDALGFAAQLGGPTVLAAGVSYAYYRLLIRRFPRAAGGAAAFMLVAGGAGLAAALNVSGYAPFGVGIWQALASPVAPVGHNLGLGKASARK